MVGCPLRLFFSLGFGIALCLLIAFALLLVALIQFHRGSSPGAFWPPLGTACKLLVEAAPPVVLLFLFFPRLNSGFGLELRDVRSASTGFCDQRLPSSMAS